MRQRLSETTCHRAAGARLPVESPFIMRFEMGSAHRAGRRGMDGITGRESDAALPAVSDNRSRNKKCFENKGRHDSILDFVDALFFYAVRRWCVDLCSLADLIGHLPR